MFQPPISYIRLGLGLRTFPYWEINSSHGLYQVIILYENIFICFRLKKCSFVFAWSLHILWPLVKPTLIISPPPWRGCVFLPWHKMGMVGTCPASAAGREPMAMGAMPTVEAHLALFVLCARNALFYPVFDGIVFFLMALISRCNGHECSEPFSGISNQCIVICSHIDHSGISRTSCYGA